MNKVTSQTKRQSKHNTLPATGILKRNCDCGNQTIAGGECNECKKKNQLELHSKFSFNESQYSNNQNTSNAGETSLLKPYAITGGLGAKSRGPLEVSKPSDPAEQEAERVVQQLFPPTVQSNHTSFGSALFSSITESPYYQVAHRKIANVSSPSTACSSCSSKLPGGIADVGKPLPTKTRIEMENAFGTDFSSVRIHTNSGAAQVSRSLNATAFTYGNEIFFDQGKYDPESISGKQLLAHELTHTVQQRNAIAMLARNGEGRTTFECVNQNLSGAGVAGWLIAIVGTTCGLIGALAGSPTGPGAAGTAALGAAICIAGVIGYSVGTVLGIIGGCWDNPNFRSIISA